MLFVVVQTGTRPRFKIRNKQLTNKLQAGETNTNRRGNVVSLRSVEINKYQKSI